jgi:HK97 family phage major capsid protein
MNPTVLHASEIRRDALIAQVHGLLNAPTFSKEDAARVESLLRLVDTLDEDRAMAKYRRAKLTEDEASVGLRTERTLRLDSTYQNFIRALRYGNDGGVLPDTSEARALAIGTDSAGGYLCPALFVDQVFTHMKALDPLFDENVISMITTPRGEALPIPLLDDTAASASIIAENAQLSTTQDLSFEQLLLAKASSWKSAMVKCTIELVQDSAFDIGALLAKAFAVRFRRGIGASWYATLIGAAAQGVSAGATAITPDNLFDLIDSIDSEYLGPKCCFLMRRATLNAIRKLKETVGGSTYYFPLDRDAEGNFLVCGFPVRISPSVQAVGTTNKSVVFGDLSYFVGRVVADSMKVRRFGETYAEQGLFGYMSYLRCNSGFAKASTADSPVKYLAHA